MVNKERECEIERVLHKLEHSEVVSWESYDQQILLHSVAFSRSLETQKRGFGEGQEKSCCENETFILIPFSFIQNIKQASYIEISKPLAFPLCVSLNKTSV